VLVGFGAQWVGVWRPFRDLLEAMEAEGTTTVVVDVDEHPKVADRYAVVSLPTFVVLQDGREVRRRLGSVSESDVRSMVR
jgi:thioredoxin 1